MVYADGVLLLVRVQLLFSSEFLFLLLLREFATRLVGNHVFLFQDALVSREDTLFTVDALSDREVFRIVEAEDAVLDLLVDRVASFFEPVLGLQPVILSEEIHLIEHDAHLLLHFTEVFHDLLEVRPL